MKRIYVIIFVIVLSASLFSQKKVEMRAAWIATVANIDWPSGYDYSTERQMSDMINILDSLQRLNINAIYFQVRPTADAFYYSDFEPWSKYLTGMQNKEPDPYYDPLAFVIKEAHARFIDVHVWLNPYRVLNADKTTDLHPNHLFFRRPDMFVKYGGKYYFNPGLEETREYLVDVVGDIVSRYDIDGVHFDDYFYPYKLAGEVFPDYTTFMNDSKGFECIEDWRRDNVNLVIQKLSKHVKQVKPWVEFGISPFGVWRNKHVDVRGSDTEAGLSNYDDLYADVLLWMEKGWIDYIVPQLYWEIGKKKADYKVLLDWWSKNLYGKNMYVGLAASKLGSKEAEEWQKPNELCRQLRLNHTNDSVQGVAYFSTSTLLENRQGLCDSLMATHYKYVAIAPSVFRDKEASKQPVNVRVEKMGERPYLFWDPVKEAGGYKVAYYVVYAFPVLSMKNVGEAKFIYARTKDNCVDVSRLAEDMRKVVFVVTSVNRFHKESSSEKYLQHYFR